MLTTPRHRLSRLGKHQGDPRPGRRGPSTTACSAGDGLGRPGNRQFLGLFRMDGRTAAGRHAGPGQPGAVVLDRLPHPRRRRGRADGRAGGRFRPVPADGCDGPQPNGGPRRSEPSRFAVWQPGRNKGLDVVNKPGSLCSGGALTPPLTRGSGRRFYRTVFGWESMSVPMPDGNGTYRMVSTAGTNRSMYAGIVPTGQGSSRTRPRAWLLLLLGPRLRGLGGHGTAVGGHGPRTGHGHRGGGRFAKLDDPYGAHFAILRAGRTGRTGCRLSGGPGGTDRQQPLRQLRRRSGEVPGPGGRRVRLLGQDRECLGWQAFLVGPGRVRIG